MGNIQSFYGVCRIWFYGLNQIRENETRLGAVKDIELANRRINDVVFVMAGDNVLDFSPSRSFTMLRRKGQAASCAMRRTN